MADRPSIPLLYALAGTEQGKAAEVSPRVRRAGVTTNQGLGQTKARRKMAKASRKRNRGKR